MIVITAKELETIRESYINFSKNSKNLFDNFYTNFFQIDSSVKDLFTHVDIKKQKRMLFDSISYFITNNEISDEDINEYVSSLNEKHQSIKISSSQKGSFKQAFLKTLHEEYGTAYSSEIESIWTKLLDIILINFAKE